MKNKCISIITPAYNEEKNLRSLHTLLKAVLVDLDMDWEWIIVDDHSSDKTFFVAKELAVFDKRIRVFRFSRNFGSHLAITCGLSKATGICATVLAADLQDPPEVILKLVQKWREGAEVVWAVRQESNIKFSLNVFFSRLYYWLMRHVIGLKDFPSTGMDLFLIDRKIINVFLQFNERNNSIFALLFWVGFRQEKVTYTKMQRMEGISGWTFAKKLKLAFDSITSYSYAPIRIFSLVGFITASFGFLYAFLIFLKALLGYPPVQGWTTLVIIILIIGGIQMIMLGILGEYLWRTLDQTRNRPLYLIETEFSIEVDRQNEHVEGSSALVEEVQIT